MFELIGAALLLGYLPGALLYRLPLWQRDRRAGLEVEERVFWHVVLSVSWSLTVVLALAALDRYRFASLLWINGGVSVLLLLATRQGLLYRTTAKRPAWTIALPVLLVAVCVWRFFPVSEYIIGGRDPGVYLNEGIQISQRGGLVIRDPVVAAVPAFARDLFFPQSMEDEYYGVRFMGWFITEPRQGLVIGQFPHLFPASIAVGYDLHGLTGARQSVAWWAILGVLAVYFVGARWTGPVAGAAAALLLALHVAQLWFARYPNSDIAMQAGVFAALLAFTRAHQDDDGFFAPVAAWLLTLQLFSRIEVLPAIATLVSVSLLLWISRAGARLRWGFLLPMVAGTLLGWTYLSQLMRPYFWRVDMFMSKLPMTELFGLLAGGIAAVIAGRMMRRRWADTIEQRMPWLTAVILISLAVYAYFWRTAGGKLTAFDAAALRDFVTIYFGWPMSLAVVAALVCVWPRRFWRDPALLLTVGAFSVFLFRKLYIVPEHFWLARRFLPVILPGLLIIGSAALLGAWPIARTRLGLARMAGGVAVLLWVGSQYLSAAAPIVPHVEYRNMIPYVERLAGQFGPRDLVLVESRNTGSDLHTLALPLAYIYAKPVLVLHSVTPDPQLVRGFVEYALQSYDRVLFVGTGGTSLLSRTLRATPIASDRVQIDEFEVTTDRLPRDINKKEFDYGIYHLTLEQETAGPFTLDVGDRDDLHVVRFHAKESTEGRLVRWTQDASELAITGTTGTEREVVLTMSDGGRPAAATPARVEVFFNGTSIGAAEVVPGFREYRFVLPAALAEGASRSDAPAVLRLVSTVWSPRLILNGPDGRELGVMLDKVTVR
jgi:uncharacterized membrane protein